MLQPTNRCTSTSGSGGVDIRRPSLHVSRPAEVTVCVCLNEINRHRKTASQAETAYNKRGNKEPKQTQIQASSRRADCRTDLISSTLPTTSCSLK